MSDAFWIVEVKIGKVWQYTVGLYPTRAVARMHCKLSHEQNRWAEFRVRKYQRVEP